MANVAVVGTQWGDEGKGKVVDWLSSRADVVVRFQGGHNAGHTLVIKGTVYKLSLLPSSVVRKGKIGIIGNGVVIDPWAFTEEVQAMRGKGLDITPQNLCVSEGAHLILPIHRELDALRESMQGAGRIGTTGRGIGPAYEDKVARRGIRVSDLKSQAVLKEKIAQLLLHHNALRRGFKEKEISQTALLKNLLEIAPQILPFVQPAWRLLNQARKEGRRLLFEGAQGMALDVDHGTYPFVTSSNTAAAQASLGGGVGASAVDYVLGITKAYATRVGEGPFPSEQSNNIGALLGERGKEFGTVTGRKRRCGWFDAVMVRQAVEVGGIHGVALTKLDVLDGMEEINLCVGYRLGDKKLDYLPAAAAEQAALQPIYQTLEGWSDSTRGARSWNDLPAAAVKYVRYIEELVGAPVVMLSTSPERDDTILMRDPFQD